MNADEVVSQRWCEAEVQVTWGRSDPTCARAADELIGGKLLCWQHARSARQDWAYWQEEERSMKEMDALAPHGLVMRRRDRFVDRWFPNGGRLVDRIAPIDRCEYCGRRERRRRLIVDPRTLRRYYVRLCRRRKCDRRLTAFEAASRSRRARTLWDYERERLDWTPPSDLKEGIPMQYPSMTRATLKAFVRSGMEAATVGDANESLAASLNDSIRRLGFDEIVFAEIRDQQTVLRQVPQSTKVRDKKA